MRTSSAAFFPVRQGACLLLLLIAMSFVSSAQQPTVGLMEHREGAWEGYTLFAPINSTMTYLIDMKGRLVHSWPGSSTPGMGVYLLSGGRLIRSELASNPNFVVGGGGGRIVIRSWEGDVLWEYRYSDTLVHQHHDIEVLPDGNVLMIAWERKSRAEAIAAGVDSARAPQDGLYPDHIVEVRPEGSNGGSVVWEWHVWDHLVQDVDSTKNNFGVIEEHPELINLNASLTGTNVQKPDWWHSNAVDYNAALDQILISVRNYSEIWVIDHTTTSEEAAGHSGGRYGRGGDLLYRYGNIRSYRPDAPVLRQLVVQHDARWIPEGYPGEGNITVFSNGDVNMGSYSSVVEIAPPVDSSGRYSISANGIYGPQSTVWRYSAPKPQDFFARNISGASRLPNGNTLICNGPAGEFLEVTPEGETVWRYINPVTQDGPLTQGTPVPGSDFSSDNLVFRCERIDADDLRLQGRDLTPGDPIELYPTAVHESGRTESETAHASRPALEANYPNPFNPSTTIRFSLSRPTSVSLVVTDAFGREVARPLKEKLLSAGTHSFAFDASGKPSGVYFYRLETDQALLVRKMLLVK
jgi:hypothetical protein